MSAGIFRIFGQEVAELPLVATSTDCQGQVSPVSCELSFIPKIEKEKTDQNRNMFLHNMQLNFNQVPTDRLLQLF